MLTQHNIRILTSSGQKAAAKELRDTGADPGGVKIMVDKMKHLNIKLHGLDLRQANIIKQEMLSVGGDAAVHRDVIVNGIKKTDTVIMATKAQIKKALPKFKMQPFGLKGIADELKEAIGLESFKLKPIVLNGKKLDFNKKVYIMGILNATPDSFSDGGSFLDKDPAVSHAKEMEKNGADLIDIGGESTRPGSAPVPAKEEIKRVVPIIKELKKSIKVPISIDTYKADVAKAALDAGADIINDISAMRFDKDMKKVAALAKVPVILMHIKGTPRNMQNNPEYDCVMSEIADYFRTVIAEAADAGIDEDSIVLDPGIGFGKKLEHNLTIIKRLCEFKMLKKAILVGLSRKAFIGAVTGKSVDERLIGTVAANVMSVTNGANILRVHDVDEASQAAKMAKALMDQI